MSYQPEQPYDPRRAAPNTPAPWPVTPGPQSPGYPVAPYGGHPPQVPPQVYPPQQPMYAPHPHASSYVQVNIRRGPNHLLHALLTLFTCGLWGIVWIVVAIADASRPR